MPHLPQAASMADEQLLPGDNVSLPRIEVMGNPPKRILPKIGNCYRKICGNSDFVGSDYMLSRCGDANLIWDCGSMVTVMPNLFAIRIATDPATPTLTDLPHYPD